jgi:hypothetical protein
MKYQTLFDELVFVTMNPDKWNQRTWISPVSSADKNPPENACGSFGCLAGNAVVHAGFTIAWASALPDRRLWRADGVVNEPALAALGDAPVLDFDDVANYIFGIPSSSESYGMYNGGNELGELWRWACTLTEGEITRDMFCEAMDRANAVLPEYALWDVERELVWFDAGLT